MRVDALDGQTEGIGKNLAGKVALRAAAADIELLYVLLTALFHALH